jgi:hypothetical protein
VPAHQQLLPITQRAFQALPETVMERYFRRDSACHEQSVIEWLRDEQRAGGAPGRIGFAVSARMNPALHAAIVATPESRWQAYSEDGVVVKACCEVDCVPEETGYPYREPLRYVAIRIGKKQQALFADGSTVKYFAVVTNLWEWTPKRLLQWHRAVAWVGREATPAAAPVAATPSAHCGSAPPAAGRIGSEASARHHSAGQFGSGFSRCGSQGRAPAHRSVPEGLEHNEKCSGRPLCPRTLSVEVREPRHHAEVPGRLS